MPPIGKVVFENGLFVTKYIYCPECGSIMGTNNECKNCVDYQDYYGPDHFADRDAEAWEELFDRLRDRQDE